MSGLLIGLAVLIITDPYSSETSRLDLTQPDVSGYNVELAKKIVDAAMGRTTYDVTYDGSYLSIDYPGGDVPDNMGVCTDVVIRSYRNALNVDLQVEVHEDMKANFGKYPDTWNLRRIDRNIDHRRVPNLRIFFTRRGKSFKVTTDRKSFLPGGLVT